MLPEPSGVANDSAQVPSHDSCRGDMEFIWAMSKDGLSSLGRGPEGFGGLVWGSREQNRQAQRAGSG